MSTPPSIQTTREDHLIAWLSALAIAIHVLESIIPTPLPGMKPGLANVVTVVVLMLFGWRIALWVSLLRVLAGSLIIGTFMTPTFWLSLAGALASLAMLGLLWRLLSGRVSALGLCVMASLAHMGGQFALAFWVLIPHSAFLKVLPPLLTMAWIFGLLSGLLANRLLQGLAYASIER